MVGCANYTQSIVRTGYEYMIPYRVGKLFAYMAKDDGVVVSSDPNGIIVEYPNGKRVGVQCGRIYGSAAGLTLPHDVKAVLKTGDTFKKGDPIAYNTNFFERDILDPSKIIWKSAMLVNTVLLESPDTLEDSSSISHRLSQKLSVKNSKIKDVIVNFDDAVYRVLNEGDRVEIDSALCLIEGAVSSNNGMLDADAVDTLRDLGSDVPTSRMVGTVDRVEIYYRGEIDDMSDTLATYVKQSDKRIKKRAMAIGGGNTSGQAPDDFRIDNEPLLTDTACIRFYMTGDVATGIGDKGVFANQLKTVFGNVFEDITTEDGVVLDAVFGQKSESDRIVSNAAIVGSTNTLAILCGQETVKAYES